MQLKAFVPRNPSVLNCPPQAKRRHTASYSSSDDEAPVVQGNWREFRAKLLGLELSGRLTEKNQVLLAEQDPQLASENCWAHPSVLPENGGLLIATPEAPEVLGNARVWQSVIFLLSHSQNGSIGFVLNRPTGYLLSEGRGGLPVPLDESLMHVRTVFKDSPLYWGGDAGKSIVHILHRHAELVGSVEVMPGVFVGAETEALRQVKEGVLPAKDFKFFCGAVTWKKGQLETEITNGAWLPAACSRHVVLKPCINLPVPLWQEVLNLCGGHYAEMAKRERDKL